SFPKFLWTIDYIARGCLPQKNLKAYRTVIQRRQIFTDHFMDRLRQSFRGRRYIQKSGMIVQQCMIESFIDQFLDIRKVHQESEVIKHVSCYSHIHEIGVSVYIGTFPCPLVGDMVCSRKVEVFIELVFKVMLRCLIHHEHPSLSSIYAFSPSFRSLHAGHSPHPSPIMPS